MPQSGEEGIARPLLDVQSRFSSISLNIVLDQNGLLYQSLDVQSRLSSILLNVILDLNGILYQYVEKATTI